MRLKRATYRHIEAEIYSYHDTLKAIEDLRRDIILSSRSEGVVAVGGDSYIQSGVERRATRLADSILLKEMERITTAIRDVYRLTKDEARRVIWVKYGLAIEWQPPKELAAALSGWNRFTMSVRNMADILAVDESTFHRYRTGFVYGVAEKLGWY